MGLKKLLRSQDLFGHSITFNFKQQGATHNTLIGGIISLIIKIGFLGYVILHIKKCILYEDNKISMVTDSVDLGQQGKIPFTEIRPFFTLRRQTGLQQIQLSEETDRFISISFKQITIDWWQGGKTTEVGYPARKCEKKDFGQSEQSDKYFEEWNGLSIFCPDFTEEQIYLEGGISNMINTYVMLVVEKCDPNKRKGKMPCHTQGAINEFTKDIQIDFWLVKENLKMDTPPGRRPTFLTYEL